MSMYNNAARTAKEMPLQLSYKEELTFCDIAACFSEEEWQLLHKWQKELYDNVMKEINHVINSLGPLIATSVFSLRPKEKDDLSSVDLHYRGRRSSINTSSREPTSTSVAFKGRLHAEDIQDAGEKKSFGSCITDVTSESDVLLKVNEYLKDAWDTDEKMCSAGQNTAAPASRLAHLPVAAASTLDKSAFKSDHILSANNICRMKEELESRFMDHSDADVIENSDRSSLGHPDMAPVILFNIKREDECHSMDPLDSKRRENATTNAMSDVTKPIASIDFYEEEEAYPIGLQDHRAEEGFYHLSGYGSMNRKRKENKNLKCHVKAKLYKSVTKKIEANVVQNVTNIDRSRGQIGYEGNQEVRGEPSEQWESDYSQQIHPTIHQVTPSIQTLETYGTCEDVIQNDDVVSRNSNPVHFFRQYTCPKREQIFQNSQTSHRQDHRGKRRYTCTECGKSLSTTSKLVTHERIHTGERPYQCTICGKSFSQKGVLLRHQIMHTGKRAHQCNVCGKCFSRKDQLLRHQKIHTRTLHFQTDLL